MKEKNVEPLIFLITNTTQDISRQLGFPEKRREEGVPQVGQTFFLS